MKNEMIDVYFNGKVIKISKEAYEINLKSDTRKYYMYIPIEENLEFVKDHTTSLSALVARLQEKYPLADEETGIIFTKDLLRYLWCHQSETKLTYQLLRDCHLEEAFDYKDDTWLTNIVCDKLLLREGLGYQFMSDLTSECVDGIVECEMRIKEVDLTPVRGLYTRVVLCKNNAVFEISNDEVIKMGVPLDKDYKHNVSFNVKTKVKLKEAFDVTGFAGMVVKRDNGDVVEFLRQQFKLTMIVRTIRYHDYDTGTLKEGVFYTRYLHSSSVENIFAENDERVVTEGGVNDWLLTAFKQI